MPALLAFPRPMVFAVFVTLCVAKRWRRRGTMNWFSRALTPFVSHRFAQKP